MLFKWLAGEIPSTCLYNDDDVYAFRDINPQMPVHFLVIPKQHIDSVAAITAENSAVVAKCFEVIAKLAAQDLAERDANAAQEAFDILKELALRFPDSRYAPEARRRMHQLVLAQAKHELGVAEYYYVRHAYVAAIQHAQRVLSLIHI